MQNRHKNKYLVIGLYIALFLGASIVFALPTPYQIQPRIIGGKPVEEGDWPWMVGLLDHWEYDPFIAQYCAGTLIGSRWVLTAAHCVVDYSGSPIDPRDLDVFGGRADLLDARGQRVRASRIVVHPHYNSSSLVNDIGLVELEYPLAAEPVQLPGITFNHFLYHAGSQSVALGWGNRSPFSNDFPSRLEQVKLPVVSNDVCQAAWPYTTIEDSMLCAGKKKGGKDTCDGDSGGPLVVRQESDSDEWIQIGITSYGGVCAARKEYGVYTRVSRYSQWISKNTCPEDEQPSAPTISITINGNRVTLTFEGITNAESYRLYWADYPEMLSIQHLDMGNKTSFAASLPWGTQLFVAVQPYDQNCLGAFSNIETVTIPNE